jgi:hypothetical protein
MSSSSGWVGYLITGRRARRRSTFSFMATMIALGVITAAPVALVIAGATCGH